MLRSRKWCKKRAPRQRVTSEGERGVTNKHYSPLSFHAPVCHHQAPHVTIARQETEIALSIGETTTARMLEVIEIMTEDSGNETTIKILITTVDRIIGILENTKILITVMLTVIKGIKKTSTYEFNC